MKQGSLLGLNIIIHDESAFFRRALRSLIVGERLRAITLAEDFETLATKVGALRPEIIILSWDENAPGRREFVASVRAGHRGFDAETRVVATSESSSTRHIRQLAQAGVNAVLLKPFNAKSALVQLERMASQIEQIRESRQKQLIDAAPRHFHHSTI